MNVRPLMAADAPAIASLARADEEALRGRPSHLEEAEVRAWWERVDLERDSWLFEGGGAPVAAGWFQAYGEKAAFFGIVAQGAKGRGLGGAVVDRAEAAAHERNLARMHTSVLSEDTAAVSLFHGRGYEEVRRFFEMAIELDGPPRETDVPEGLELGPFHVSDAHASHAATVEAFQDHWEWHAPSFDEWWKLRQDNDHTLWFVVRDGDEIAAFVRNELRDHGGYVGLIGVRRAWRGRGLGKALLNRSFTEFWQRGRRRVTLHVDAESPTGATKLYEGVGMHVESTNVSYER